LEVDVEVSFSNLLHLAHSAFAQLAEDAIGTDGVIDIHRVLVMVSVRLPSVQTSRSGPMEVPGADDRSADCTATGPARSCREPIQYRVAPEIIQRMVE
jgi:hypothetical protein